MHAGEPFLPPADLFTVLFLRRTVHDVHHRDADVGLVRVDAVQDLCLAAQIPDADLLVQTFLVRLRAKHEDHLGPLGQGRENARLVEYRTCREPRAHG